jgi:membrane protease YdiL (CAAX protease family)
VSIAPRDSDYERRSLWLALAVGLVVVLRPPRFATGPGQDLQIWLYVVSSAALGVSLLLCLLFLIPGVRERFGPRLRDERNVFAMAVAFFVLGLLITIVAGIESAIDLLDEDTPFR